MSLPLYICGAGGFAREVAESVIPAVNAQLKDRWKFAGFVKMIPTNAKVGRHEIVCSQSELKDVGTAGVVIAIGNPGIISSIVNEIKHFKNLIFPNLIHPSVEAGHNVIFGEGNIVCAGNIFTTDIEIGSFNIFNLGSTFGHDTVIGDCCVINPGAHISGGSKIENECLFGTGSIILENLCVKTHSVIGGGAVVTKNVNEGQIVTGIPAKSRQSTVGKFQ